MRSRLPLHRDNFDPEPEPPTVGVELGRRDGMTYDAGATVVGGFIPCDHENRRVRRAAVALWQPPDSDEPMPTRRALLGQRQKRARGICDPEMRRLQRANAARKT